MRSTRMLVLAVVVVTLGACRGERRADVTGVYGDGVLSVQKVTMASTRILKIRKPVSAREAKTSDTGNLATEVEVRGRSGHP